MRQAFAMASTGSPPQETVYLIGERNDGDYEQFS